MRLARQGHPGNSEGDDVGETRTRRAKAVSPGHLVALSENGGSMALLADTLLASKKSRRTSNGGGFADERAGQTVLR